MMSKYIQKVAVGTATFWTIKKKKN